jgi:hypothetical protein
MSCKVSSWSQNIAGIQYAIDNGADVISMSRSEKWRFTPKPNYDWWRSITDNELLLGIFHANSIGNEGDNQNTDPVPFNISAPGGCPAPWRHPDQVQAGVSGIIGCGAVDQFDGIASYSSIGPFAWEDIRVHWPAYPYAVRPEYQDYPWWGGDAGIIKPDIVAPGPDTRSTQPGGGYAVFSGTSAATPHIAGAMALCLQANPELTPESMAMILQTTASDLGSPGKDNVFGAGKLNCHEAVIEALAFDNLGVVSGSVVDAATQAPIAGVLIEVVGETQSTMTNPFGYYQLVLPANTYTLRFIHFDYDEATAEVTIDPKGVVDLDQPLDKRPTGGITGSVTSAGPVPGATMVVEGTPIPETTTDAAGDYHWSSVPAAAYQVSATAFGYEPATQPVTVLANETAVLDFSLTPALIALDLESDPGWEAGVAGDNATGGIWVRVDPVGTQAQPEDDHSADPGVNCFVTGQGAPGGLIDAADVDGGTTTLRTALIDLSTANTARVSYWRWYSNNQGVYYDDQWVVQISSNGGATWVDLERTGTPVAAWTYHEFVVTDYVTLTTQVMVKFVASDLGLPSVVEAGVDDFQVFGDMPTTGVDAPSEASAFHLQLAQNQPNPFNPATTIGFVVPGAGAGAVGPVALSVYDVSGRLVRNLIDGPLASGKHAVEWDGRDARGLSAPSGIYLYRLTANGQTINRRMVLLK